MLFYKIASKDSYFLLSSEYILRKTHILCKENYYFTTGDNVMNSQDSRYWGLLPEPHIVGKARWVWKSINPYTDKIRWERTLKKVE